MKKAAMPGGLAMESSEAIVSAAADSRAVLDLDGAQAWTQEASKGAGQSHTPASNPSVSVASQASETASTLAALPSTQVRKPAGGFALEFIPKEAGRFLKLLGKDRSQTWLRFIDPTRSRPCGADRQGLTTRSDLQQIEQRIADGFNVYAVIGDATTGTGKGGAIQDADITSCPAVFVEWDDGADIDVQAQRWQALGLPVPTLMLTTGGKSVHVYWALREPMAPEPWRVLMARLIEHCDSDRNCKNPARVMRLPGSVYFDKETGKATGQCRVIASTGVQHDAEAIAQCLPAPAPQKPVAAPPRGQLQPRSIEEINAAAECIPHRVGGEGTYDSDRNALCGCSAALAEAGHSDPDGGALALLAHKWPTERDAAQVLSTATTRNAASFWAIAREHGHQLQRSRGCSHG